ncbi:Indole-3-glycerol phosphate synthase [Bienertia sinuspersici]
MIAMARNFKAKSKSSQGKEGKRPEQTIQKSNGRKDSKTFNSKEKYVTSAVILDDEDAEWAIDDNQECVKIDLHEIQLELDYWASAIYCCIIGANPPVVVMEGFIRRVWGKYGIDKVIGVKKSLYLIRCNSMENCKTILNEEKIFFDSKPIMLKAWFHEIDVNQEDFMTLPIWIHLHSHYKYLGLCTIKVNIGQEFPSHVFFIDENNKKQVVPIIYEWRPVQCSNCKGIGHDGGQCYKDKRKPTQQAWRPKQINQGIISTEVDQDANSEKQEVDKTELQVESRTNQEALVDCTTNSTENRGNGKVSKEFDLQQKQHDNRQEKECVNDKISIEESTLGGGGGISLNPNG